MISEEEEETQLRRNCRPIRRSCSCDKEYLEGIAKTYGAEATVTVEARRDRMTFVFDTDKQGL